MSLLASEANPESCHASKMELFGKIVKTKSRSLFLQKPPSWMFNKVLNMLRKWLLNLRMFHF